MGKSLVLVSGGMDSATCLAMADQVDKVKATLTCQYGQSHQQELVAAKKLSDSYGVDNYVIQLPDVFKGAGSTLVDGLKQPEHTYAELREQKGVSPTYVPFRNGVLLSIATAKALTLGCDEVWFGAHAEDARHFAYPDCTPEFIGAMSNAIYVGTYFKVRLITPLMWMMKKDVVEAAYRLKVPLHLTRTCYSNQDIACGKCPSCVERKNAFAVAGHMDPIEYA